MKVTVEMDDGQTGIISSERMILLSFRTKDTGVPYVEAFGAGTTDGDLPLAIVYLNQLLQEIRARGPYISFTPIPVRA